MQISFAPLHLPLKHPFTLGNGTSRTHTPILLIKLSYEGFTGIGEAAMPPYLGETCESAQRFLSKIDLNQLRFPFQFDAIHKYLESLAAGNSAAKAAIDIALHDLWGKIINKPLHQLVGSNPELMPPTTFTLGIDDPAQMKIKAEEAEPFQFIKIKIGGPDDRKMIESIREITDKPLYVDVNQGWTDPEKALEMAFWLQEQGVCWIEQPFPKNDSDKQQWLFERSPIKVIADEACQQLADIPRLANYYHGINIKLMKSRGIHQAKMMLAEAKKHDLITLIGCMTETSCATMAAAALAPQFDHVDIDGPWILKEQPFQQPELEDGKLVLNYLPGLGLIEG